MGRHCAVPNCYSGYRRYKKNDEKISLYKVPDDEYFLLKWNEAIAREDRPVTPKDYVCDKHFTQDDIIKTRVIKDIVTQYQRPKLRQDAIPSIFPDLPEYITKMTKKRRKVDITSLLKEKSNLKSGDSSQHIEVVGINVNVKQELEESDVEIKQEPETHEAMLDNEIFIKEEYFEDS